MEKNFGDVFGDVFGDAVLRDMNNEPPIRKPRSRGPVIDARVMGVFKGECLTKYVVQIRRQGVTEDEWVTVRGSFFFLKDAKHKAFEMLNAKNITVPTELRPI